MSKHEIEDFYSFSGLIQGLGTIVTPRVCTAPASSRGGKEMWVGWKACQSTGGLSIDMVDSHM